MLRIYLRRRLHSSWQLTAASLALFAGIVLARMIPASVVESPGWLCLGVVLVFMSVWRARVWVIVLALAGGLLIGMWRGSLQATQLSVYKPLYGATVNLSGTVAEDVDINKRDQLVLRLKDVSMNDHKLAGKIWVTTSNHASIQRSDIINISGKLDTGFGTFAAAMYSVEIRTITRPEPGDVALKIRNWFASGVDRATSEPQTSLGLGYLVGQRRGLPEELDTALKTAGLMHIVVASGYNLTILVRLARRLFEKVSKYLSFITASSMIVAFVAITGMSPSMSRAGLVAGLSLLAWYYGRRFHPIALLSFAIAITTYINPSYAWGDLGWQLSFAAFAGVMLVAPIANVYFFGDKPERPLGRILVETMSAQICTLPIILVAFGQASVIAPIANMLILPLVPLAMLLTFIAGIGGLLLPFGAAIVGLPAEAILTYMTQTIYFMGNVPWALQDIELGIIGALIIYIGIGLSTVYMWRKTRYSLRNSSIVE